MKRFWFSFFFALIATSLSAASFDCQKTATEVEKLICSNEELSKLDVELEKVYKEFLDKTDDESGERIKREQRAWLQGRDVCKDSACIKIFYTTRILKLAT
ncbi:MAG: lysozyme inhibitor LprI family protein [Helicobacteraceae bacterium]|nr:lysozyme inhibitor LprI family protein [Helicobacteraceae bacterium]